MNKFALLLLVISVLTLIQIPLHTGSNSLELPGTGSEFLIHRGFVLEISAIGLENGSIDVIVNGVPYQLGSGEALTFHNISGNTYISSSSGAYLLSVSIFPQPWDYWFYLYSSIAFFGAGLASFLAFRKKKY